MKHEIEHSEMNPMDASTSRKNVQATGQKICAWIGRIALLAILLNGSAPGQTETKYRDRINLPGVRITREYVDTGEARQRPAPPAPKRKPAAPRLPRAQAKSPATSKPQSPIHAVHPPDEGFTKMPSLDLVDRLFAAVNPNGIHDVYFEGDETVYGEDGSVSSRPFRATLAGPEGCRVETGKAGVDETLTLLTPGAAWRVHSGIAEPLDRDSQPEFAPYQPAVAAAWAFKQLRAQDALVLVDRGRATLAGQACRVVDAIHRGDAGASASVRLPDRRPDRTCRLWLDSSDRLVRLDYRGLSWRYEDFVRLRPLDLVVARTVRGYAQGVHQWDQVLDLRTVQAIDPPDPALFEPDAELAAGLFKLATGDFSAEKIWNENRPDTTGGDAPFGAFHGDSVASVNVQSLNLNVTIPLTDYPQRGAVNLPIGLTYNSKLWDVDYAYSQSKYDPAKLPQKWDYYEHLYSRGSAGGWNNLAGLYSFELKKEHYDRFGRGRPVYSKFGYWSGEVPKILEKMYLCSPDGSVHELMDVDDAEAGDILKDPYTSEGFLTETTNRMWETTDGSQIRVELGDRGQSGDVLRFENTAGTFLMIANGYPGIRVLTQDGAGFVHETDPTAFDFDTPWAALRLLATVDHAGVPYLFVATDQAGVQIYNLNGFPASASRVAQRYLNDRGVADMKLQETEQRLWVLTDQLAVVDIAHPEDGKVRATCRLSAAPNGIAWDTASLLEVSGDHAYVAAGNGIDIYQYAGAALTHQARFVAEGLGGAVIRALVRDGSTLYALARVSETNVQLLKLDIGVDGLLTPLGNPLALAHWGRRLFMRAGWLYILGYTHWDEPSRGYCTDVELVNLSTEQIFLRTVFAGAYQPRTTGLTFSADGTEFYLTGWNHCCAAFDTADFLAGDTTLIWDDQPVYQDPTIYFPDGRRVVLAPGEQRLMDANGNTIRITEPDPFHGQPYSSYEDTLGRVIAQAPVAFTDPVAAADATWIPYVAPGTPEETRGLDLPGYTQSPPGYDAPFSLVYQPLSDFLPGNAPSLTTRGTELILDPEIFPCQSAPRLFGGSPPMQTRVINPACFNPMVLAHIVLPNGRSYSFDYNRWGEMTKITYPTGGYERFEHGMVPLVGWHHDVFQIWANRGVLKRFISAIGDGSDECAYVYETVQQTGGEGSWDNPPYFRVIRRVKFYADATQATGTPDALEEHYFYRPDKSRLAYLVPYGLEPLYSGKEYETRLYLKDEASGQMKLHQRILREYQAGVYNPATGHHLVVPSTSQTVGWRNPLVTAEMTMVCDAGGTSQRTALVTYEYERDAAEDSYFRYCRLKEKRVYDYVSGGDLDAYEPALGLTSRRSQYFNGAEPLRVEKTEYLDVEDPEHAGYKAANLVQLPVWSRVEDAEAHPESEVAFEYDLTGGEYYDGASIADLVNWQPTSSARGNLSRVQRWISDTTVAEDHRKVNVCGEVIQYADPMEQTTDWEYGSGTEYPDYHAAYVTAVVKHPSTTLELRTGYEYDPLIGKLTAVYDPNHTPADPVVATFEYDEPSHRLTQAVEPNGREIGLAYDDANRIITVTADWDPDTDPLMHQETVRHFDGLGRLTAEAVKVGPASAPTWRWSQREYDAKGRLWKVYNPTATQTTEGVGFTTTVYDSLDRVTTVENPDQTARTTQYDLFNVSSTTPTVAEKVSDENGKWKKYSRDAAGRIVQVIEEDPATDTDGPVTTYAYTATDKLAAVEQDAQTRSFEYDGLGNLISAQYPEIDFTKIWEYDLNGQLYREHCGVTNDVTPLPQWIQYDYDGMGRVIRKLHLCEDSEVEVVRKKYVYIYDGEGIPSGTTFDPGAYPLGRLTGKWEVEPTDVSEPGAPWQWMELYAYDESGRLTDQFDWLDLFSMGQCLTNYIYSLSGGLTGITYPSGKQATFTQDLENKPLSAGTESSRALLASSLTYALHGALDTVTVPFAGETARADLIYHRAYTDDKMLRVDKITLTQNDPGDLMNFQYSYEANGNIAGIDHLLFGGVNSETFAYDKLNRLSGATFSFAGVTPDTGTIDYEYDRFGNMYARDVQMPAGATDARGFDFGPTAMAENNRLPETAGPFTFTYDERGNLISAVEQVDETHATEETFRYDAENRLVDYDRWWWDPDTEMWTNAHGDYIYNDGYGRMFTHWEIGYPYLEKSPLQSYVHSSYISTVFAPGGEILTEKIAEWGAPFPNAPLSGQANPSTQISPEENRLWSGEAYHYQFLDHLGTTRYIAGTSWQWGTGDTYLETNTWLRPVNLTPYGSEIHQVGAKYEPDTLVLFDPLLFTGKPRDFESGLDYFGARYYSNTWCRWLGADQPFADNYIEKPSSWNLFLYVRNNPINSADPNGSETLEGVAQGGLDFVKTSGAGILESYKALALGPLYLAYTSYQTTAATGRAWLTQEGRDRMSNTWEKMGSTGQVAVQTNLALQLITTTLAAGWAFNAPTTAGMSPATKGSSNVNTNVGQAQYFIESGVRRAVASREAGLSEIPATIYQEGQAPITTTLKLEQLHSPKPEISMDARYTAIQPPILTPIDVQPLGLPRQPPSVPLFDVKLVPCH